MSERPSFVDAIGGAGAALQIWFWDFIWRIVSDIGSGARTLWRQPYGVWVYLGAAGLILFAININWAGAVGWITTPIQLRDLVAVLAAPLALFTLILLARRTKALETQVRVSELGQITERYSRAVELLGHGDPTVRTGAIRALTRIAQESEVDFASIYSLIQSFAIQRAIKEPRPGKRRVGIDAKLPPPDFPPPDIKSSVVELRRLYKMNKIDFAPSLRGADFSYWDLRGIDLREFDVREVDFSDSDLRYANLTESLAFRADFSDCNLTGANLTGGHFSEASFQGADLTLCKLSYALLDADFQNATTVSADIEGANLLMAKNLTQAQISQCKRLNYRENPLLSAGLNLD
ncbi:MAG: pentapeptide repeat-containing protein [Alphaproteobacteria bacterium]